MNEEEIIEDIVSDKVNRKVYSHNPTTRLLGDILKKKGRKPLYEKFVYKGETQKIQYSNKYDSRAHNVICIDDLDFNRIAKLSGGALKMLFFIMFDGNNGKDYLVINKDKFARITNQTTQNYYRIVNELLDNDFIFKSPGINTFWINSLFLTKGSPIELYKQLEIKEAKSAYHG